MLRKNWIPCLILCSLIVSCLLVQPVFAAEKTAIAVYQLKAEAVSESMANILSDVMRDAIFQTGKYRMLTKEDMKRILDNIADRQKIQPDCDSTACLLEIAGALGVEKMITGNIGKLGNTYVINLRLVDTELADTENTLSETCLCKEDVLINKIRQAGLKLLGEKVVAAAPPSPAPRTTTSSQISTTKTQKAQHANLGEMVLVQGGTFEMGDTFGGGSDDEKPVHEVTLDDFYIDKYEVTQKEYKKVIGENPSYFKNCEDCPVESVTWFAAQEYCDKVGKRLPTEAEWEYAARSGGKKEKWAGTSASPALYTWYSANSGRKTHPVGQKKPNGLGIYDMSGNVWEWCSDWYDNNYYRNSPKVNPQGPSSGNSRVLRGGSWFGNEGGGTRSALRLRVIPDYRGLLSGFRCARTE